jgi:ubiquinone/menaquinone biosynthesis C-methylase UbiE
MRLGLYDRCILPRLTHLVMRNRRLAAYRERAVAHARGEVLEIGMGSGLNLPFYGDDVRRVLGVDPSLPLVRRARQEARKRRFPLEVLIGTAEALPLPDASVDTAVTTWSLCTLPDPLKALSEVRRVLRAEGELLFVEHGQAPEANVARWQDRLTPLWRCGTGGCHLNRPIDAVFRQAGFAITSLEKGYMGMPRFATFMYEGTAKLA